MVETSEQAGGQKRETRNAKRETMPRRRTPFQRLRRRAFHLAALGSALLLVAVLILWPRSYFREDEIRYAPKSADGQGSGSAYALTSIAGRVRWWNGFFSPLPKGLTYIDTREPFGEAWDSWTYRDPSRSETLFMDAHELLGCVYLTDSPHGPYHPSRGLIIPYSYLALLSAITPALWLLTRKRRRREYRLAHGLCPICGYDLRGHAHLPDARCPECGTPVPRVAPA